MCEREGEKERKRERERGVYGLCRGHRYVSFIRGFLVLCGQMVNQLEI
jgi:hypothetical protein